MIFYTGSYTQEGAPANIPKGEGIGCFKLNQETGVIKSLHYTKQRNPSYLVISKDKKYLYAVEEMLESLKPRIFSYKIENQGLLKPINSQELVGDYACHLAIIQDQLVVANYVSGNALSFQILEDGSLAPCNQFIKHVGTGPNKERQESAHVHMVYPFKKDHMFLVDLGLDKAKVYQLIANTKSWKMALGLDLNIEPGSGARHMVLDKTQNYAFILSELTGAVFVLKNEGKKFKQIQKILSVPQNCKEDFGAAAIRLHPSGQFLYTSARGSNTITIFKINEKNKMLSLVAYQATEGKTPRDFNIDPTGEWLIAANQDSGTLVVFKMNKETGLLTKKYKKTVETPVNITWLC
ncbi:lactonase family protein [Flavivirga spongiicola]|uniref:Lactonase family protein n=1 Tax=Flavivirga spongiicola TaxID=421621 RepID=A0ABU7XQ46_9FLAO|nr:lactonase family protein [Flavivirga sp. MEBiC05379]MDO5977888.1 lactonase family protein [Flavivirga sp. MEBiC05379]